MALDSVAAMVGRWLQVRYLVRLLVSAGCIVLFTLLMLQDARMYVQTMVVHTALYARGRILR